MGVFDLLFDALWSIGSSLGFIVIIVFVLMSAVKIVTEYQRLVVFRLGRLIGTKGPGLVIVIPFVDRVVRVDLRTVVLDVPVQEVITKDNVPIKVNAVVYFRVMDSSRSVVEVENHIMATSQLSQTTLRSVIGSVDLDDVLSSREKINGELQKIIDDRTDPWGIKVSAVEVKELELPEGMKRAMAKQAEAERERRSNIINAEGERAAAETLAEAARIIASTPGAINLRTLNTVERISTEPSQKTTILFPVELLEAVKTIGDNLKK